MTVLCSCAYSSQKNMTVCASSGNSVERFDPTNSQTDAKQAKASELARSTLRARAICNECRD